MCLPSRGDEETTEILRSLGSNFNSKSDEVTQACNLAAGSSDIVIILERPLDAQKHRFNVSFGQFVRSSKTLSAVDELIRFATQGARSIYNVTVLNAFSYQPGKDLTERDRECHEALARILQRKKPKVILRCHREEYRDEWLRRIELPGEEYRFGRNEINITEEYTTIVLQSFHPSCAINNTDYRPEYRALLIYHFVAAFRKLRSEFPLPDTAETIRELCLGKGKRRRSDIPSFEPWQAAFSISHALGERYTGVYETGRRPQEPNRKVRFYVQHASTTLRKFKKLRCPWNQICSFSLGKKISRMIPSTSMLCHGWPYAVTNKKIGFRPRLTAL